MAVGVIKATTPKEEKGKETKAAQKVENQVDYFQGSALNYILILVLFHSS